jgi:hypothetical protein
MPDDNTQQPQPTVSTVDQNQITPEIADPTQAQPAPSLFQSAMAPVTQQQTSQQPPTPADPAEQAKAARDKQLDFHPLVTAAHVARKVGEALSGGTQYKETFDESGNVTRTPIPPTTKSIITGALANILGGISQAAGAVSASRRGKLPRLRSHFRLRLHNSSAISSQKRTTTVRKMPRSKKPR